MGLAPCARAALVTHVRGLNWAMLPEDSWGEEWGGYLGEQLNTLFPRAVCEEAHLSPQKSAIWG